MLLKMVLLFLKQKKMMCVLKNLGLCTAQVVGIDDVAASSSIGVLNGTHWLVEGKDVGRLV